MQSIQKGVNVFLWYLLGGILMGFAWLVAGIIMFISISGIKFVKICFSIAKFNFFPTGKTAMHKDEFYGNEEFIADCWESMCGQFWFVIAGWWLALGHLVFAVVNFITIIGIPSGQRHLHLACISFNPIEQIIVSESDEAKVKKVNALRRIQKIKNELSK